MEQWTHENEETHNRLKKRTTKNGTPDKRFKTDNKKRKRSVPIGELSGREELLKINVADLYGFLGVYTEMGLHRLFATDDYWKTGRKRNQQGDIKVEEIQGVYGRGNGIARQLWSEQAWRAISIALCHVSQETLFWMELVFNERAKQYYIPSRVVVIDELSWPYKGHSRNRNYNPKKVSTTLCHTVYLQNSSRTNGIFAFMLLWMSIAFVTV